MRRKVASSTSSKIPPPAEAEATSARLAARMRYARDRMASASAPMTKRRHRQHLLKDLAPSSSCRDPERSVGAQILRSDTTARLTKKRPRQLFFRGGQRAAGPFRDAPWRHVGRRRRRGDPGWVGRRVRDGRERRLGRSQGGGGPRAEQARQPALRAQGASPRAGGTAMPRTRRPRRRARAPRRVIHRSILRSRRSPHPPRRSWTARPPRGPASRAPCRCARARASDPPLHVDRLRPATRKSPAAAP